MSTTFRILLLAGLVICAVATALVRKPMRAVIIYMAYSIIMSVVAAAGISGSGHHRGRRGRGDHGHPVLPDPAAH